MGAFLAAGGSAMIVTNISANSLLQSFAPASVRGQSASLFMLALRGGSSLGALATGASVDYFGVRNALLANGVLAVAASLAIAREWMRAPVTPDVPV